MKVISLYARTKDVALWWLGAYGLADNFIYVCFCFRIGKKKKDKFREVILCSCYNIFLESHSLTTRLSFREAVHPPPHLSTNTSLARQVGQRDVSPRAPLTDRLMGASSPLPRRGAESKPQADREPRFPPLRQQYSQQERNGKPPPYTANPTSRRMADR